MKEEILLEKIKDSARSERPPEKLEPDVIKKKLNEKRRYRMDPKLYRRMAMAAVFCLIFLGGAFMANRGIFRQKSSQEECRDTCGQIEMGSLEMHDAAEETAEEEDESCSPTDAGSEVLEGAVALNRILAAADSYDQIRKRLETYYEDAGYVDAGDGESAEHETYYTTNIQEEGAEEGDLVKTDGTYLYIVKDDASVCILKADGTEVSFAGSISGGQNGPENVQEMYVVKDKLILIGSYSEAALNQVSEDVSVVGYDTGIRAFTYDISDRSRPRLLGSVDMDGSYVGSRLVDGYLYLYTNCYKSGVSDDGKETSAAEGYGENSYVPSVAGELLEADAIYLPEKLRSSDYMVLASVDLEKPDQAVDKKAILSVHGEYYVSLSSIYLTNQMWDGDSTAIIKIDFSEGRIVPAAAGMVNGSIHDNFSMSEYQGYLRVVTTQGQWLGQSAYNHLYVMDEQMNIAGKIENLAEGETIQSARFLGDIGYFVTYRNMDPLFSVDLSDPFRPQILGELKVTGFSEYLHFYGENLLFGFGYETDPDTGETLGMKMSMYDISDPSDVKEVQKKVLDLDVSPALWNYKSLLIDADKGLIGFLGEKWGRGDNEGDNFPGYFLYRYDPEQGFVELFSEPVEDTIGSNVYGTRGVYIGDIFYLINLSENKLVIYDLDQNGRKVGETRLY